MLRSIHVALLCGLLTACGYGDSFSPERPVSQEQPAAPAAVVLKPVPFESLPGWGQDSVAAAVPAFLRSCRVFLRQPEVRSVGRGYLAAGTVADWHGPCRAAERLPRDDDHAARRFFESWFEAALVQKAGGDADGLFTGYYEVELAGSLVRQGPYRTPILGRPGDLVTVDLGQFRSEWRNETLVGRIEEGRLRPYPDRARLETTLPEVLPNPTWPVVAWVRDPVDVFLLHIQGAGLVHLGEGASLRIGYTADNGHKFVGIARRMIKRGLISREQAGMVAVRDWLRAHPVEARALMAENPRFVFFRTVTADGPVGAQGVPLTAGRSLAIDPKYLPLGAPLWLDTRESDGAVLRRLVIAQDTGNAITGPVRGDFFWGHGDAAFAKAGGMKSRGRYYVLLPRSRSSPTA
ncbi:MAG: membrane-bound lytic murein transglycosylase A [Rhodospirillaceae bacterium]|nr:MAG: membrane-bound lytic murein transglycosylase A [Rhodospirillaceae bacterium]